VRRIFVYALVGLLWRMYGWSRDGDHRPLGMLSFVLWSSMTVLGLALGTPLGLAIAAAGIALAYPWLITRAVLIPLGLWWPALWLGKAAVLTWGSTDGGAVAGALALAHRRRPPQRGVEAVDAHVRRGKLTAPKIIAAALLARCRDDRATARALMQSVDLLDEGEAPRCHRIARDFRIADAAGRGDWRQVRALSMVHGPLSRLGRFVGLVAARLEGDASITDRRLRTAWLLAPRRRTTRSLLRRALDRPGTAAPLQRSTPENDFGLPLGPAGGGGDPIAAALEAHVHMLRRAPEVEIDDLFALGSLWDRAIDSGALRELTRRRAADLQATGAEAAVDGFAAEIETELAGMVRASGVCMELIPRGSAMLARAVAAVRRDLLAEIELAFAALEIRFEADRQLAAIDEWREMLALRELYAEAARVGGLPLRQIAFPQMHTPACNYAVWLWNTRAEYLVANAVFRWLLAEATVVGDAEAIDLQTRNVAD
jgi:hypothetical protein